MKNIENRSYDLEIIAGPCSISSKDPDKSLAELHAIAEIQVPDSRGDWIRATSAVRFIGLKSRTVYNPTGEGMGLDFAFMKDLEENRPTGDAPPSVLLAEKFVREAKMGIAAEIMLPNIQLPFYEKRIPKGMFLPWNPSNEQLGWSIRQIALVAERNNWIVGLKNGKWLGKPYEDITQPDNKIITSMEENWLGMLAYTAVAKNAVFIHRGVDIPEKGEQRNALVHEVVRRLARKAPHVGRYLDPSHSLGEKLRDGIVERTIDAMTMMVDGNSGEYLYTGILIEVGTSETDSKQHISVDELRLLVREISNFRHLRGPLLPTD